MRKGCIADWLCACLIAGVACLLVSITGKMLDGPKGDIRFASVSNETRWILLPVGIIMTVLPILFLRKQKFPLPTYTDEDIRQAKEKLDRMYLETHGTLPEPEPSAPAKPAVAKPRES